MATLLCMLLFVAGLPDVAVAQSRADKVKVSHTAVNIDGESFIVHNAARREKLGDIAVAYGVSEARIREHNPEIASDGTLKFRSKILIPMGVKPPVPSEEDGLEKVVMGDQENTTPRDSTMDWDEQYPSINQLSADTLQQNYNIKFGLTRPVQYGSALKVALLLPFEMAGSGSSNRNFVEFYNGFQLALKEVGQRVELTVISTDRTEERIHQIALSGQLDDQNVIIGPVYGEEFEVLAPFAGIKRIPIVSPLGRVAKAQNPFVIEITPAEEHTWDKVVPMLADSSANVIVIEHMSYLDTATINALNPHIPPYATRIKYSDKNTHINTIKDALKRGVPNVVVMPLENEIAVEELLSRISSARGQIPYDICVVGTPRWARFTKINQELFYKLKVGFPTSFYFDRLDKEVKRVYADYIREYNNLPTLFAMRGYDVAMTVVAKMFGSGDRLLYDLMRDKTTPLQTSYDFEMESDSTKMYNTDWPLIIHNRDFTIEVQ